MRFLGLRVERETRSGTSLENPTIPVSAENFLGFFGMQGVDLPAVTTDTALKVPAVMAAVAFLSRTLAAVPKHAYRETAEGPVRVKGKLGTIVHKSPNDQMGAFKFWQFFWQQVFTGGRGLAWIERSRPGAAGIEGMWLLDPTRTTIQRDGVELAYKSGGKTYPGSDVIDVPFMLRANQLSHYGPINLASKAIQLALAMNDYASTFFAGGGVPPLALTGPLPAGADALKRAMADIHRVIDAAKKSAKPVFPLPPGHDLKPVGFDPDKGQMTEARKFQTVEIARAYQLPPVFLQDLERATFTNAEQQDLHLVKHLIGQWTLALEDELNLKLFGRLNPTRYIEHNLDALMRGDFKSRIEGLARGVQSGLLTPNEGRAIENRPNHRNSAADELFMQGATVELGRRATPPVLSGPAPPAEAPSDVGDTNDDAA
ncbi:MULTISPECIES: phage portal protein [Kaistia]|uniref:Phage portal protein n=1 Tax=Kaistia nematophila TaxID=2994654 RepID=A0A9X3ECU3_9HYPH|nr:phage portal protein [Kaistia nematophila]MCX5570610.1 phage portal protein [Kaistia nematophila]